MSEKNTWDIPKLEYILLTIVGLALIIYVIYDSRYKIMDTFKSIYKLPVLKEQKSSYLGICDFNKFDNIDSLSNLQQATVPIIEEESNSSNDEYSTNEVPMLLTLFTPNEEVPKLTDPSIYSRLKKASDSGILRTN